MKMLSDRRGFTLIESFAGSVIFAIALFVVGLAIYAEFSFINQNREKALATMSGQEYIERMRAMSFDNILAINSSWAMDVNNKPSAFAYLRNPQGTVTVDSIYGQANIRRVSVTIAWDSLAGGAKSTRLVTLMSRNGINKQ
jgi:type II secretory pathway pseudopilin PulG